MCDDIGCTLSELPSVLVNILCVLVYTLFHINLKSANIIIIRIITGNLHPLSHKNKKLKPCGNKEINNGIVILFLFVESRIYSMAFPDTMNRKKLKPIITGCEV